MLGGRICSPTFISKWSIWDQGQQKEVLITIADNVSWSEYKESWKPTWKLRNTKVLDANLQAHTDIVHLVPERRVY